MEKFSFTHLRRESGIDLINDLDLASIKHNDLKPVFAYNNKDVRKSLIVLEKQFRLNYVKCLERLKILEQHLLLSGFVYLKDYDGWISTFIKPTNTRTDLNDFYPIFVKKIDDHWIEISYSFRAEVTSNIDEISKESFSIYDASGGRRFSLMWVGGTHIYHANKMPNDMGLIDALLANYLYD